MNIDKKKFLKDCFEGKIVIEKAIIKVIISDIIQAIIEKEERGQLSPYTLNQLKKDLEYK
jgi:hypothetical protein